MPVSSSSFLKSVEIRLLRCTFSEEPPRSHPPCCSLPPHSLSSHVEALVDAIESGRYADALSSDAARLVFPFSDSWEFEDSTACASRFYDEVERAAGSFLRDAGPAAWLEVLDADTNPHVDLESRCALLMCLGVAALLSFTQQNVTG